MPQKHAYIKLTNPQNEYLFMWTEVDLVGVFLGGGEIINYISGATYRVQRILLHTDSVASVTIGTRHSCCISGRVTSFEYCTFNQI